MDLKKKKITGIRHPHLLSQIYIKLDHSVRNGKTPEDGSRWQKEQRHPSWILRYAGPKKFLSALGPKTYELFKFIANGVFEEYKRELQRGHENPVRLSRAADTLSTLYVFLICRGSKFLCHIQDSYLTLKPRGGK